jgi:hypothetical protein
MDTMKAAGLQITDLPAAERAKWINGLPDIIGPWLQTTGDAGKSVLRAYFDELRSRGIKPLLGDGAPPLATFDVAGLELLSLHPPADVAACMYTATMSGRVPACAGDYYFVDSWKNDGIDEWYSETWSSSWEFGQADANAVPGGTAATNRFNSSGSTTVEVGLLGLHTKTNRVRSVIAASIASRSKVWL